MQIEKFTNIAFIMSNFKSQFQIYNKALDTVKDIANSSKTSAEEKKQKLSSCYQSFYQQNLGDDIVIKNLKKMFESNRLDSSLFTDIIAAYNSYIDIPKLKVWEEFIAYHRLFASPISRFILAIYDENPTTYLPMEHLYTILEILSSLSSIKNQISYYNRCLIPQEIMLKYNVRFTDLALTYTSDNVQKMMRELIDRISYMQADVQILPSLIKNFGLRVKISIMISLTNSMIKKYQKANIIQNAPVITLIDKIKALVCGVFNSCLWKKSGQGNIR